MGKRAKRARTLLKQMSILGKIPSIEVARRFGIQEEVQVELDKIAAVKQAEEDKLRLAIEAKAKAAVEAKKKAAVEAAKAKAVAEAKRNEEKAKAALEAKKKTMAKKTPTPTKKRSTSASRKKTVRNK